MFKKVRNIETAFQSIRIISALSILSSFAYGVYINRQCNQRIADIQSKVYILSSGKALEAFASDRNENIPVEARDHIAVFHKYFFTLAPDEKVIYTNISKALYLADESARRLYENLKEGSYYANVISSNISQEISIDSIQLNMTNYPFYFRCYSIQKIIRTTSVVTRNLITEGFLRTVSRSDNNPHGFLIERWNTLENKDLKIETK
ncbi:MAG: conjugative transposon protein TraK [Puia sp.]|nr:conjugative transposon protein TraK [Puia sp.]